MQKPSQSGQLNTVSMQVAERWPVSDWINAVVLVAVSGGPDSVALLRVLTELRDRGSEHGPDSSDVGELIVWHYNHKCREESNHDEQFVAELAAKLGHRFVGESRQLPQSSPDLEEGTGWLSEESLRSFRYDSLLNSARQFGARYVVTGHNRNDQVETVLFRLFRGTGFRGLTGIPAIRVDDGISIVRPLLSTSREEIEAALDSLGQTARVDVTNADSRYARNFLRNELIPNLQSRFGDHVEDAIVRLSEQAEEVDSLLDTLSEPVLMTADCFPGQGAAKLPLADLRQLRQVVRLHTFRLLWRRLRFPEQEMSREKWRQLDRLVMQENAPQIQLPGSVMARVEKDCLLIERAVS